MRAMTRVHQQFSLPGIAVLVLVLFCALSAFSPVLAQSGEIAGRVISASGEVAARDEQFTYSRVVIRRSEIHVQETIATSDQSRVQMRMMDSALLSLGCESSLKIEEYAYEQNAANDRVTLRLLSGRFRTITGAVGEQNQQRYRLLVGDITIQILGTGYEVTFDPQTQIAYVGVYDGSVSITNPQGTVRLGIGGDADFARIESGSEPEALVNQPPQLGTAAVYTSRNPQPSQAASVC